MTSGPGFIPISTYAHPSASCATPPSSLFLPCNVTSSCLLQNRIPFSSFPRRSRSSSSRQEAISRRVRHWSARAPVFTSPFCGAKLFNTNGSVSEVTYTVSKDTSEPFCTSLTKHHQNGSTTATLNCAPSSVTVSASSPIKKAALAFTAAAVLGLGVLLNGPGPCLAATDQQTQIKSAEDQTARLLTLRKLFDQALDSTNAGDFASAEVVWTKLIELIPEQPEPWSNRGNARVSQGKLKEAVADYNQAIELDPKASDPYLNRGVAFEGLGRFEDAIADYNRVLQIDAQDPVAYNNRGNAEGGLGQWDKAVSDYSRAAAIAKDFVFARANLALALYQTGQPKEAISIMRGLVLKYSTFADMRAALAAVLYQDNPRESERQWSRTLELDYRYADLAWVKSIRRWPPAMIQALEDCTFCRRSG